MCWGCAAGGLCHFFVFSLICRRQIKKEVAHAARGLEVWKLEATRRSKNSHPHQPFSDARRGGRTQVDEAEDDLISFRDPGHRAGPGGLD